MKKKELLKSVIQEMNNIIDVLNGVIERVEELEQRIFNKPHGLVLFD
jgi:hypothetical protein